MKKLLISSALFVAFPLVALAQTTSGNFSNISNLVHAAANIISSVIPILIAIAMIVFFWGLIQYIRKPEFAEGKKVMIAGIIALFIMVAIWGIVTFAASALGVPVGTTAPAPGIPGYNSTSGTSAAYGVTSNGAVGTPCSSGVGYAGVNC